jgi:hypothetical protein
LSDLNKKEDWEEEKEEAYSDIELYSNRKDLSSSRRDDGEEKEEEENKE